MPRKTVIFLFLVLILGLICFSGFLIFNKAVFNYAEKSNEILQTNTNDNISIGIVALTGGRNRIETAVKLLNIGLGERMLISGVKPGTKVQTITSRENVELLTDKSVDLGYKATDTVGNAKEVKNWSNLYDMQKIYVVTSFYHIPRSRLELERELHNKDLSFVAANTPFVSQKWKNWRSTYFMAKEYIKFLIVYVQYKMLGL
jgi:uncharacterized SAM-binding protein YcdF (DUF218 family)